MGLAGLYACSLAPVLLGHNDLGWHLAAGDLIRADRTLPLRDPWSFTANDKPWVNLSWGWDVAASLVFSSGGSAALTLVTILFGAALAGGMFAAALSAGASALAAAVAVVAASAIYPVFALPDIFLAASPNMATLAGCVAFQALCIRGRRLWVLPLLMLAWVNLHGGFVLGLGVLATFAAVAAVRGDRSQSIRLAAAGAACLVATLANPLGWRVYAGVLETVGHFVQNFITEWQPFLVVVPWSQALPTLLYVAVFVVLDFASKGKADLSSRLLSWAFLLLGFRQLRYLSLFFLVSSVPIAQHLSSRFASRTAERSLAAAGLVLPVLLVLAMLRLPAAAGFPGPHPVREIAYLQDHRPNGRVLNHWNYGSQMIYQTRGGVPVFVDGRAATAYPDEVLRDYFRLATWEVDERAWRQVLSKYDIDTVLWVKAHEPLAAFLVGREGWRLAFSGPIANIYVRD